MASSEQRQIDALIEAEKWEEAVEKSERFVERNPKVVSARVNLASCLTILNKFSEAERHAEAAIDLDRACVMAWMVLVNALLGLLASFKDWTPKNEEEEKEKQSCLKESFAKARHALDVVLTLDDTWAEGHFNKANILSDYGGPENEAEALHHYEKAAELSPDDVDVHINWAVCLQKSGQLQRALQQMKEALRVSPNHSRVHQNLSSLLLSSGDLDNALSHAKTSVDLDPSSIPALSALITLYTLSDQPDLSFPHYSTLFRLLVRERESLLFFSFFFLF